jgi:aminoglycoside phosphotransferase (APT) family kinase protein
VTLIARGDELATALEDFLETQLGSRPVIRDLRESSAGARRRNVFFTLDDGRDEIRLVATIIPTAAIQQNPIPAEAAIRTLARANSVPVPATVAVCDDDSFVGGPFFVSELVEGETIPRRVLRLVDNLGLGDVLAAQVGAACARLHGIDPALAPPDLLSTDLPGTQLTNPAEIALAQLNELMDALLEPRPVLRLGMRWLRQSLPPAPPRRTLVHSDIRVGNLIVGPDGLRAILDWEGSRRGGDPMEDLAWPALRTWRFRADEREIGGLADRDTLVRAYEEAGGTFDLDRFRWWKVLGTLRWAIGLAGQAAAHLDGRFRSVVMAASGRRVTELEWDLLMLIRPRDHQNTV